MVSYHLAEDGYVSRGKGVQRYAAVSSEQNDLTGVHRDAIMYGRRVIMQETKLTVRVPRDLLENIKRYAAQNNTTLTNLIEAYLRRFPALEPLDDAPIVQRLSGSLSQAVSILDYKKHLEEKYEQ
jgi:hypothetical protein